MARKKPEAEPLLRHKHAFIDSLDNTIAKSILIIQAVEFALKQNLVEEPAKTELTKVIAEFRAAIFNDD